MPKFSSRAKDSLSNFQQYNNLGLQGINDSLASLKELSKELNNLSIDASEVESNLKQALSEFKDQCVELEIKGKDVDKLFKCIDDYMTAFSTNKTQGVIDIMESNLNNLIKFRTSPDRGAVDNFPLWKVGAIIIGVGAWIIGAIHCVWFSCSIAAGVSYAIIVMIAGIVLRFC